MYIYIWEPIITQTCSFDSCTIICTIKDHQKITWTNNQGQKVSGPVWVVERSKHLDVVYTCTSSDTVISRTKSISKTDLFPNYSISGKWRDYTSHYDNICVMCVCVTRFLLDWPLYCTHLLSLVTTHFYFHSSINHQSRCHCLEDQTQNTLSWKHFVTSNYVML